MIPTRLTKAVLTLAASVALASPAAAHHPLGGITPRNFYEGFLSGVGHPVIGLDHLAAIVGVGIIAALLGRGVAPALAFIAALLGGVTVHLMSLDIPAVELLIGLSTLAIGLIAAARIGLGVIPAVLLFAGAGLVNGYALGESIIGAEPTPLAAYFAGLFMVHSAIAILAYAATRALLARGQTVALTAAGAVIALMGGVSAAAAAGLLG